MLAINAGRIGREVGRFLGSTWTLGVVIAFLSWPTHIVSPGGDIDTAWQLSLQMAAVEGLNFGTDFVLNGGPLEFVLHPLIFYTGPGVVSGIYILVTQLGIALTLVWTLRRSLPVLLAAPLAYLVLTLDTDQFVPAPVPILVLALIWALVSISDDAPGFVRPLLLIGGGIGSAVALLVQFSEGFLVLFICGVAVLVQPGDRRSGVATFSAVFGATLAVLWFAAGQSVSNADDYVRTAFEVVSEWSTALPYDLPQVSWDHQFAAAAIAATFLAVYLGTRRLSPLRRGAAFLLVAVFDFSAWKHGFVIHLGNYAALFTSLMLTPWLAFRWRGPALGVALSAIAILVVLFYPLSGRESSELTRPIERVENAREELETLFLPGPRGRARAESRQFFREWYHLDRETLALLRGRSVLSYPWEIAPLWAYELDWHPIPAFPYLAYTPYLDQLNADAVSSPNGPEIILRHRPCGAAVLPPYAGCEAWTTVGPTFLPHETPSATIAMLCNFEPVRTTRRFQVLERVPDRCGRPHMLSSEKLTDGEVARIPAPPRSDEIVFARVHGLIPHGLERLRTFLYRATNRLEVFDGEYAYRVVPGTMEDGVILRVPPKLNFEYPFPATWNARTVSFQKHPGLGVSDGDYGVEYFAMPVRPPAGPAAAPSG